jgi:DNA-directed RNA polymerase subunit K/omega
MSSSKKTGKKATGKKATGKKATGKKATGKKATGKKATGKKATGKKATNLVKKDIIYDEDDDDIVDSDFNVEEELFFDEQNFKDFNEKIKFHVFDPEQYENEIRKEIVIVPDQYRKTSEVISKCEFTDVVSNRAKQIEDGSPIFVDIGDEDDPIIMAEMETRMKKCPLSIVRMISNNIAEVWAVNDMIVLY